jgi:site-specific DNA recombinase
MTMITPRIALYARVSTAHQAQERTIEAQLAALEAAARAQGLSAVSVRHWVDDGFSGARLDRPALDALRDAAADGELDAVFVYAPDRLARNYVHQHVLLEELTKRGVAVHFVERPIGASAEDRLLVQMQGVIAEYERAKILERTRRGKLHKLRSGQLCPYPSVAPYGYAVAMVGEPAKKVVVIDEGEAAHVRAMFRWVLEEDFSTRAVAKRLNAEGVRPRRAQYWTEGTVHRLLTSPAYMGHATYNRFETIEPARPQRPGAYRKHVKSSKRRRPAAQWLTVPIPAIVEAAAHHGVRAVFAGHQRFARRNVQHDYLLRGLVVCGACGRRMRALRQARAPHYEYFLYGCTRPDTTATGRAERCRARRVRQVDLEAVVWAELVGWIQTPQLLIEEVEAWRTSRGTIHAQSRERREVDKVLRQSARQLDRLLDAYQHGALSVEELKARRDRLAEVEAATRARAEALMVTEADRERLDRVTTDLVAFAATLRAGLAQLDFAGRERLVRLLIERVVVTDDQVTIEHVIPLSGRFARLRPGDRRSPYRHQDPRPPRSSHRAADPHPRPFAASARRLRLHLTLASCERSRLRASRVPAAL